MKVWLTFLEWVEFLVTPLGLVMRLWVSLYLILVQRRSLNLALAALSPLTPQPTIDWGEAIDVSVFYNRTDN
ncbi:MAG: hypothetical protein KME16_04755 [Scytolyngbya sp. HA4215-MV1]|jgi:hypothetical protein|nr:hypothetical protein [Scytolyngbya sp. HA4215-MV1]